VGKKSKKQERNTQLGVYFWDKGLPCTKGRNKEEDISEEKYLMYCPLDSKGPDVDLY